MNLTLYRLLLGLLKPIIAFSAWRRCRQNQQEPDPKNRIKYCFASRFGRNPTPFKTGGIWIHAVSVGETRSTFPLLKCLHQTYPNMPITLTNGSTQGALQALNFAPVPIQHQMIPYDYPSAINRFLNQIQPKLVIMIETEIWPNLYQACFQRNIPIVLANARLKEHSFLAYQKWGGKLIAQALQQTQFIAAQFDIDAKRFKQLGAPAQKTQVLGNLKFDIEIPPGLGEKAQKWRQNNQAEQRFIWVAASTHPDEEVLMLEAHQQLLKQVPNALLILVPRHANRFAEVKTLCQQSPLNTAVRSLKQSVQSNDAIYLADTIGELMLWFEVSNIAFIGGSLVPFGGHNILEPAALSKPVVSGKWHQNLQALYDSFIQAHAINIVDSTQALATQLIDYANAPKTQQIAGKKAYQCFSEQTGALNRLCQKIAPFLQNNS